MSDTLPELCDDFALCVQEVKTKGLFNCKDIPYKGKVHKGQVAPLKEVLQKYAECEVDGELFGKPLTISALSRRCGLRVSVWYLSVIYPEVRESIEVAETARAERLNELAAEQLFDDNIINHYGKNDDDELSAPGVALLKARNKEMARQAENFNKKKFGKDPSVTISLGSVDPVSEATSLDDLRNVSMIQLRPPGKRERDS